MQTMQTMQTSQGHGRTITGNGYPLRTVFMGTPDFAVPTLMALCADERIDLVAVVTRPDAASGRGKKLIASAVRKAAESLEGIDGPAPDVLTPENLRGDEAFEAIAAYDPDLIVVASYGCILPKRVLDIPRLGCVNIHASLLPRHRGAAPIQRAILEKDELTGVSLMLMGEGLDTGDYCATASTEVLDKDCLSLTDELAVMGAELLMDNLDAIASGNARWERQDEDEATYASKVTKAEMLLDPADSAQDTLLKVRASSDQAPAKAVVCGKAMTVLQACAPGDEMDVSNISQGEAALVRKQLMIGCSDGAVRILNVKPDGKKEMDAVSFCAGVNAVLKSGEASWEALR